MVRDKMRLLCKLVGAVANAFILATYSILYMSKILRTSSPNRKRATKQHLPGLQCVGSGPHGKGSDSQRTRTLPGTSPELRGLHQRGHQ